MTASEAKKKKQKKQRSTFLRIISSPKTTLVLGIFAFASIVYYKVKFAPPDEPKKKPAQRVALSNDSPLLMKQEILGRVRDQGPLLTRSFFKTGDIIITGSAPNRRWGLILAQPKAIYMVHPTRKSSRLLPWLRSHKGRFALYRVFTPSSTIRQRLAQQLATMQRAQPLPASQKSTLQDQWLQTIRKTSGKAKALPPQIGAAHWVAFLYRSTGIDKLPSVNWSTKDASSQWLAQLIEHSHYSDLAK